MARFEYADIFREDNRANIPVYPLDVFVVTDEGKAEIEGGATQLPADALKILVLLDAGVTVGDLEQKLPHLKSEELRNMIRSLLGARLVRAATLMETGGIDLDFSRYFDKPAKADITDGVKASALAEAASGAPQLTKDGYYVSIARRAVKAREPAPGKKLSIFLVEDDPDMVGLVKLHLEGAGFEMASAANRAGVVARLRQQPMPDAILLDVNLPDVNGFDILLQMKKHPVLKTVPVIMVTAEAKRDSVMRGLTGGADGYITKPFKKEKLLAGVRAVLGLA
jgi:CheY-like chemotaxis protein